MTAAAVLALPEALRRYARHPARWRAGNRIALLRGGGEAFPEMIAAIAGARRTVHLETYILVDDRTGARFAAALRERAAAGVAVRVLYDAFGALGLPRRFVARLAEAGVDVRAYNPLAPWRRGPFAASHRDHRKVLIVDDEVAFTGGLNLTDDAAPLDEGGAGWHDLHCAVRGPVVRDLARGFRRSWLRAGGAAYPAPAAPADPSPTAGPVDAAAAGGATLARVVENTRARRRRAIRRAYAQAITRARRRVLIQNAYFLPDRGLCRALAGAVARGVDVRVVIPGHSDVRLVEWAGLHAARLLARRGVKILRYRGPMMHAKAAVVDDAWATVGTYNLDALSRDRNLELTLEVLDPAFAAALAEEFARTEARCEPLSEAAWRALPRWRRLVARLAYQLRHWL